MKLRDYTEGSMFLLRFQFRLIKFDRKNWRIFYKTLLLLEHLLTHGPLRVADEFQCDKDAIKEMASFQFVDEKGSVELLIDKLIDIQF
jgi:epsin